MNKTNIIILNKPKFIYYVVNRDNILLKHWVWKKKLIKFRDQLVYLIIQMKHNKIQFLKISKFQFRMNNNKK